LNEKSKGNRQKAEIKNETSLFCPLIFAFCLLIFRMKKRAKGYTISAIADHYGVHQQTLRLYEREGLLKPSRSDGNVRLYTDEDIERLEVILKLTRDLGVNLAGVEIILNMREKMDQMQREFNRFLESLRNYAEQNMAETQDSDNLQALVPTRRTIVLKSAKRVAAVREMAGREE
jgi:MerR family transcriptional regulator, heat shock protein HspR